MEGEATVSGLHHRREDEDDPENGSNESRLPQSTDLASGLQRTPTGGSAGHSVDHSMESSGDSRTSTRNHDAQSTDSDQLKGNCDPVLLGQNAAQTRELGHHSGRAAPTNPTAAEAVATGRFSSAPVRCVSNTLQPRIPDIIRQLITDDVPLWEWIGILDPIGLGYDSRLRQEKGEAARIHTTRGADVAPQSSVFLECSVVSHVRATWEHRNWYAELDPSYSKHFHLSGTEAVIAQGRQLPPVVIDESGRRTRPLRCEVYNNSCDILRIPPNLPLGSITFTRGLLNFRVAEAVVEQDEHRTLDPTSSRDIWYASGEELPFKDVNLARRQARKFEVEEEYQRRLRARKRGKRQNDYLLLRNDPIAVAIRAAQERHCSVGAAGDTSSSSTRDTYTKHAWVAFSLSGEGGDLTWQAVHVHSHEDVVNRTIPELGYLIWHNVYVSVKGLPWIWDIAGDSAVGVVRQGEIVSPSSMPAARVVNRQRKHRGGGPMHGG